MLLEKNEFMIDMLVKMGGEIPDKMKKKAWEGFSIYREKYLNSGLDNLEFKNII